MIQERRAHVRSQFIVIQALDCRGRGRGLKDDCRSTFTGSLLCGRLVLQSSFPQSLQLGLMRLFNRAPGLLAPGGRLVPLGVEFVPDDLLNA